MKIIKDIPYTSATDSSRSLDLYLPEKPSGKLPLIVLIHGGGWMAGDKDSFGGQCQDFVRRGYAAASLNYRLSNQAIFPAQIVDCKAAVRWLRAHARTYGLDGSHIVVGGHSAGGHLAALMGVTNGKKAFDQGDHLDRKSDVQAVLWFAGVSNFVTRVQTPGYESEADAHSGQSLLIGGAVLENEDKAMAASPITYVSSHSAPTIFFHGDSDKLVPVAQAKDMYDALHKEGVACELHILVGSDHGGPGYFTPLMYNQIDAFLAHTLKLTRPSTELHLLEKGKYVLSPISAPRLVLEGTEAGIGIAEPTGHSAQKWTFTSHGDSYTLHPSDHPLLALTVVDGNAKDGARLALQQDSGKDSQLWLITRDAVSGHCTFSPKCAPGSALDDFSGNATPQARIDLWTYNGTDPHLQWTIVPSR